MRIVIDMQGAQTESRFRGIGRYTMSFTKAVVQNRGEHEVILALSGLFPETIEPIRAAFYDLLPQENIRVWYAPGPVCESQPANRSRRETAEILREAFLASLEPDIIHISSLFEGYLDDAVTSIGQFDTHTPVSIILYDLIPLLNPKAYLDKNRHYKQYYMQKIQYCPQVALCLAISDFSAKETIDALNLEEDRIVNISAAIDPQFSKISIAEDIKNQVYNKFGINKSFILYTGGSDARKNLPRLIEAYATLPEDLVNHHDLVLAGKVDHNAVEQLKQISKSFNLASNKLIFTNYINDEELVQLYNLCKLYVFPSWHEGCGLPALEAMACGAPVIGANTSSLPEVIGLPEALFDPFDVPSISQKISQALQDEEFRTYLHDHGLARAKEFSWNKTAKLAIQAWELLHHKHNQVIEFTYISSHKPKLAFVSPIPPERTGIADYSKELLPALAKYYQIIIIIVDQDKVDHTWLKNNNFEIQDLQWLKRNSNALDRVIYQLGNSPFHKHMLQLMQEIPGIAVLHDFYMSDLMFWLETQAKVPHAWTKLLYRSHGYKAVKERYQDVIKAKIHYPVNFDVFKHTHGVILHSNYSQKLSTEWYLNEVKSRLKLVPLVRGLAEPYNKSSTRKKLGFTEKDYLVCSFGFLDPVKLNLRLLDCWLKSQLSQNENCYLIFVGENHGGSYGQDLLQVINDANQSKRIRITGFLDSKDFNQYLMAADVAVQLRRLSRGETSAAVLDCMNYSLPVIVNAHGTLAELDRDTVWMLPDDFKDEELIHALEELWRSPENRHQLGDKARQKILESHAPDICAHLYAEAIEYFHKHPTILLPRILQKLTQQERIFVSETELLKLSVALSKNNPPLHPSKQLYLDITATRNYDLKTGIQRVARAITLSLLEFPPVGYRVEPVYLSLEHGVWVYRYARKYTLSLIECSVCELEDEVVEPSVGDIILQLDLSGDISIYAERAGLFSHYRDRGVLVYAVVFDLLPVLLPHVFPPGADQAHHQWLQMISKFDGAVCISKAVADDLRAWQDSQKIEWNQRRPYNISWFHLGSDIFDSAPTQGLPDNSELVLATLKSRITFLMVGTVEPRKAYMQVLDAFDALWEDGENINLVIVGHEGWKHIPDNTRRDIPQTVKRLRRHPQLNKNMFWLEGITDEYLEQVYAASTCLIAASYGEGFGLPLIEAARHKLPILARDIPVFREVAGDHACYFNSTDPGTLKIEILQWVQKFKSDLIPKSEAINFITWKDSASQLLDILLH